ncbi:hypothetical protein [Wolbachia endosymbiont of Folsomia candida]|uniref:hypothetical protein n=1 Tax=Wolbachia endosymbiont of Folsomia candida TaxID=169402 RepID=UPI000A7A9AC1|nr:hypothetical protein [Wolbachia endosymbiont of Folsomia candida]APR98559.1 hypothetical protein ASM33_04870 [Wolbachia endosymbiont of Folsomia candida]
MTIAKEAVYALHKRLKDLTIDATPDQLAYLAKSLESIAGQSTVLDIVQMTDEKLKELLDSTTNYLAKLDTSKTSALGAISESEKQSLKKIDEKGVSNLSLLDTRKDANIAAINSAGDLSTIRNTLNSLKTISDIPTGSSIMKEIKTREDQLKALTTNVKSINDVPSGSSIMKEVRNRNMIDPGTLPFVFGIVSRQNDYTWGSGHFTTELGKWYLDTSYTDNMFCLLTGAHTHSTSYVSFYKPPSVHFMQGKNGTFIYRELYTRYTVSSNEYTYPYALLGVVFVKNTTSSDITRTLNFVGSSYWNSQYEGAGVFVGTPNNANANKTQISAISWKNIYNLGSSNSGFSSSGSVIVPANKTVAILFYTSPYYYTNSSNYYAQFMQWGIYNFRSNFLTTGLAVDVERTLKAWQCQGLEQTFQIWN